MRRLATATGPLAGWDRDFTIGVALSTLLHAGVGFLVLWLVSRTPAPPPPVESYTVELTDPAALGGRLAFGPLDRQIGRPRRIADAAGGAPAGEPHPGESPRAETAKPPKGAAPERRSRASEPQAPVKPPAQKVADEPELARSAPDAVVAPPTPDVAKPSPKGEVGTARTEPPKPVPPAKPAGPVAQQEPAKPAPPAAEAKPKPVRLPEPKKMLELPRKVAEPKPAPEAAANAARATPTTVPVPQPRATPTTVPAPQPRATPTTLPAPPPKAESKPEPARPPAQMATTADEPSPGASTEPPTPARPNWRAAGPKPLPGARKPVGVAEGARGTPDKPMAPELERGTGAAVKPEPTAPAAGLEGTGTGGTPETPVEDEYAAAAERWRSRMAGGAGGMGGVAAATGAIGDGTTDAGGGGSVVGFEFLSYRQRIFGTIKANWTNTVRTAGLVAAVRFELAPDGQVSSVELVRSSGDRTYDQAVVRAVQRSNPLPPPPERYREDFREVIIDFHSEEQGGDGAG
jgi:TonB family protein